MNMLIEIFFPCYFGTLVTEKSREIPRFLFFCEWIRFKQSNKKSIIIFMTRANKEIVFYAGRLFVVGLAAFVQVLLEENSKRIHFLTIIYFRS